MMEETKIFKSDQFGEIRTVIGEDGEPWFLTKDVCAALGYSNARDAVGKHVDDKDVAKHDTLTAGGKQSMTYVNESGLYALIFGSKQEQAQAFKRWVTSEVLPSIRKHGAYMKEEIIERTLTDPDYLIKLATTLKEEQNRRRLAEEKAEQQTAVNVANRPKVAFAEALLNTTGGCNFDVLAKFLTQKGVPVGRNTLIGWMRNDGFLFKEGPRPIQKYVEMGLFVLRPCTYMNPHDGTTHATTTTLVTGNGQMYFLNYYLKRHGQAD